MTDLIKRLGWTTSLAFGAALIAAGCDNRAGDTDQQIETVEPSPPGIPSTDPYGDMPAGTEQPGMMGDMPAGTEQPGMMDAMPPADEPGGFDVTPPADEPGAFDVAPPAGTGIETTPPEPTPGTDIDPEVSDEPAEPGIDDAPPADEPND